MEWAFVWAKGGCVMLKFSVSKFVKCFGLALLLFAAFQYSGVLAEDELIGSDEYRLSCLNCHGVGGKGNGPMVEFLIKKPSDLTVLSKNHNGEYPFYKVYQTIDGRILVPGHGDRDMPIWGVRYLEEDAERYGGFGGEDVVRARILQLVYYIQMLQQK